MFEVSIENSFDFRSAAYVDLFERSAATPFQGPVWLDRLYNKLLPHNAARPLILVVRRSADKSLAMVLPLVSRRYSGLRVVEFADLRVSDYVSPVTDAATFAAILADGRCVANIRSHVQPYDLLRIGKLAENTLAIERLFDIRRRDTMGMSAYEAPLGESYELWREERLPRSYRKELDKKSRQLHRRGVVRFECCENAERTRETLEALRFYRGLRFGNHEDGTGDLLQVPAYFDFYLDVATEGQGRYARTYGVTVDGRTVAGALGLSSRRGSFMVILSGFDHDSFKNQSLGSLLFEQIARDCIERGERFLDFTIGDEPYKLTFGAKPSPMWQVSRAGSPLGYAARLLVERMPAARSLARRLFHGSRDLRTIEARPVAAAASTSKEPAAS
ncbi:MAG: GNAT family N-acetyltransferase [Rhizobiaceae bacterium]|jgi:CelD/BcsL family acetyltransferase involved in cellulose biosynthesis